MRTAVVVLGLAGCGGGGAVVEAAFAPGTVVDAVSVAESGRAEAADSAGFRLAGLTPGPARLRLVRGGDTVGLLQVAALPAGSRLRLEHLRVDPATGLAFPRAAELEGAATLTLNGVRFGSAERAPRRPDLAGTVLGWTPGTGALLLRPADGTLPDLRVLVVPATAVVDAAGDAAGASALAAGDSVHLVGRREGAYVVAERLVVPAAAPRAAVPPPGRAEPAAAELRPAAPAARRAAPPAAPAARPVARPPPERERERGPERGKGRGKGKKGKDG